MLLKHASGSCPYDYATQSLSTSPALPQRGRPQARALPARPQPAATPPPVTMRRYATRDATTHTTLHYATQLSRLLQRCCSAAAARRRLPKRLQLQPTRRRRRRRLLRVERRPARLARFVADALARALAQPIHILWGGRTSTTHTRVVLRNRQVRPPHTVVLTGEV